ncbi:MAG TPA: lysophospholipid acyltransferase family protein [Bacillus sp. (in: firmicutes)]|nr:lysophospholipid acyltransferase family protein [Bacillus sp. (in: firmicutes)]
MLRLLCIVLYVSFWFLFHIPYVHIVKKRSYKEEILNAKLQTLIVRLFKIAGLRLNVTGQEHLPEQEPVLFAVNHESHLDPLLMYVCLRRVPYFVMKAEIESIPVFRTWMKEIGHIALNRGDRRSAVDAVKKMKRYLEEGKDILIFPEGTITKGEKDLPFKPGSFKAAFETEKSIVPITIKGSARGLEQQHYLIKPNTVEVIIHPKVETEGGKWDHTHQLAAYVEKIIKEA